MRKQAPRGGACSRCVLEVFLVCLSCWDGLWRGSLVPRAAPGSQGSHMLDPATGLPPHLQWNLNESSGSFSGYSSGLVLTYQKNKIKVNEKAMALVRTITTRNPYKTGLRLLRVSGRSSLSIPMPRFLCVNRFPPMVRTSPLPWKLWLLCTSRTTLPHTGLGQHPLESCWC